MTTPTPHQPALAPPPSYAGPRRSLILAGGGMRLAYQAGVLLALEEAGLCFAHADGTSGGIFNLGMLFSGLPPTAMCQRWSTLRVHDFVSYLPVRQYLHPLRLPAFASLAGLRDKVFPHLGIEAGRINQAVGMAGTFNVCNYSLKTNEAIAHQAVTYPHLLAGVSLPMLMPAVQIGPHWYTDSVWVKDANLMEAVRRGAEELWVVWAIGNIPTYRAGAFNQYVHMIEMSANGVLFEELAMIRTLNERIARGDSPYGQRQPVVLHVIKPRYPLPLDPDLYFNRIDNATLVERGYADARHYLGALPAGGVALAPSCTQMLDQGTTLALRLRWQGTIGVGAGPPYTSLLLYLAVQDVAAFAAGADEVVVLSGRLEGPAYPDGALLHAPTLSRTARADGRPLWVFRFRLGVGPAACVLEGEWQPASRTMHLRAWPVASPRPAASTGSVHLGLRAWLRLRRGGHIGNTGLLGQLRARYLFTRLLTR